MKLMLFVVLAALLGASRVGGAGVTVALPKGWHSIPLMVPPPGTQVDEPVTRVVAASAPIDFGPGCNELDYRFPDTGVAIVVVEWIHLRFGPLPPRPRRFTAKTLPVRPAPALECVDGPGGGIEFSDQAGGSAPTSCLAGGPRCHSRPRPGRC